MRQQIASIRKLRSGRRPRPSLARVVGVSLAVLVLGSSAVLSAVLLFERRLAIERDALTRLEAVGNVQVARVEDYLDRAADATRLAAAAGLDRSAMVDPSGPLRVDDSVLRMVRSSTSLVESVAVLDGRGRVVAADDPDRIGVVDPDHSAPPRDMLRIGPVVMLDDRVVLRTALGLRDGAALVLQLSTAPLRDVTADATGLGETGETIVAQRNDTGDALFLTPLRFDADATLRRTVSHGDWHVPITRAIAGRQTTDVDAVDYRGEPVFAVTRPVSGPFGLVVKIDRAEALRPLRQLQVDLLRAWLVALIATGLVAASLTRRLTRPVSSLTAVASEVARGHRHRRAVEAGPRELAELANAVNRMTDDLVAANAELHRSNARLHHLNAELEHANAALVERAMHDPLTRLPNRALLLDRLQAARERAHRDGTSMAVLYCDLDGFKEVNDRFGHEAGDRVLVATAQRMSRAVRAVDTVARIGGDEFIAVCGGLAAAGEARRIAASIREAVARPVDVGAGAVDVSISIGVVVVGPDEAARSSPAALLRRADTAMYCAKADGGCHVEDARSRVVAASAIESSEARSAEAWTRVGSTET